MTGTTIDQPPPDEPTPDEPTPDEPTAPEPALHDDPAVHARRWWTLAVLCLSLLIVFVGNSSLNVAIPTLSRDLHASNSQLQWVIAAYSLVFAGLLFSSGATGDRYGRKGALQFGLVVYLLACLAATWSTSMPQLIACRAAMGVGAAFIMPSTLSILVNVFPPEERTKAIAIWASVTGAAGAIGPVASGWLLGHFWYGSVFLVNVPILVLALVSGRFLVPRSKDPQAGQARPGRRRAVRHRHRGHRLRAHRGARRRVGQRRDDHLLRGRHRRADRLRVLGAAQRRAHARHPLLPHARPSAPAPAA